jgi:hypothetical protein
MNVEVVVPKNRRAIALILSGMLFLSVFLSTHEEVYPSGGTQFFYHSDLVQGRSYIPVYGGGYWNATFYTS